MFHTTKLTSTIWRFAAFALGLVMACQLMGSERIPTAPAIVVPNVFRNARATELIPNVFYDASTGPSDSLTEHAAPAPICVDGVCQVTDPTSLSDNLLMGFRQIQTRRLESFGNCTQWSCPPVTVPAANTNNLVLPECVQCVSGPAPIWRNNNMPAFRIRRRFRRK